MAEEDKDNKAQILFAFRRWLHQLGAADCLTMDVKRPLGISHDFKQKGKKIMKIKSILGALLFICFTTAATAGTVLIKNASNTEIVIWLGGKILGTIKPGATTTVSGGGSGIFYLAEIGENNMLNARRSFTTTGPDQTIVINNRPPQQPPPPPRPPPAPSGNLHVAFINATGITLRVTVRCNVKNESSGPFDITPGEGRHFSWVGVSREMNRFGQIEILN